MKSLPSKVLLILLASLLTVFFLVSCSSEDDPVTPDPPQLIQLDGTVGTTGGTLTSSDGKLSITFPPGALATDTDITISEVAPEDAPAVFDGLVLEKAFTVEPAGLELAEDVEISLTLNREPAVAKNNADKYSQLRLEARFFAVQDGDSDYPLFEDTEIEIGGNRNITAELVVLNFFAIAALTPQTLWVQNQLAAQALVMQNSSFITTFTLMVCNLLVMDTSPRLYYSANSFTFELENGETMTPDSETTESDGSITTTYNLETLATDIGVQNLECAMSLQVAPKREAFADLNLPLSVLMPIIHLLINMDPISVVVEEEDPVTDDLPLGVHETQLALSDGLRVARGFLGWELNYTMAVSNGDGMTMLHLQGDPPLRVANDDFASAGDQRYGSLLMGMDFKNGKAAGYRIMLFGPDGGSSSSWVPENHSFGMQHLFAFGQNLTDAMAYDNNPLSIGYCFVNHTLDSVQLMEFDSDTGFFQSAGSVSGFQDATGNAISAYAREGGSVLVAVDGTPGRLYLQEISSLYDTPAYIDDLGHSPRRIRSMGDVAAISNFASGTLTIVSWSQTDEVTVTETVTVGDGPVGIDLLELDGGNIAIASTGFNDDTYWVTVVSPNGTLVSNSEYSLPAGISGAGHAAWAHDANNRILISGNTTGNLAVVASGL